MRDGKNLQNFLICIEMLGASFGMVIAFPYTEYKSAGVPSCWPICSILCSGGLPDT